MSDIQRSWQSGFGAPTFLLLVVVPMRGASNSSWARGPPSLRLAEKKAIGSHASAVVGASSASASCVGTRKKHSARIRQQLLAATSPCLMAPAVPTAPNEIHRNS